MPASGSQPKCSSYTYKVDTLWSSHRGAREAKLEPPLVTAFKQGAVTTHTDLQEALALSCHVLPTSLPVGAPGAGARASPAHGQARPTDT